MRHYLLVPLLFSCTFCNGNIYFCNLNATCPTSNAKLSIQQYLSVLWKVFLHGFETWYTRWVDKCKFNQIYLDIKWCHHMQQCSLEIVLPELFLYLFYMITRNAGCFAPTVSRLSKYEFSLYYSVSFWYIQQKLPFPVYFWGTEWVTNGIVLFIFWLLELRQ